MACDVTFGCTSENSPDLILPGSGRCGHCTHLPVKQFGHTHSVLYLGARFVLSRLQERTGLGGTVGRSAVCSVPADQTPLVASDSRGAGTDGRLPFAPD